MADLTVNKVLDMLFEDFWRFGDVILHLYAENKFQFDRYLASKDNRDELKELVLQNIKLKLKDIEARQDEIVKELYKFFGFNDAFQNQIDLLWYVADYFWALGYERLSLEDDIAYGLIKEYINLSREHRKFSDLLDHIEIPF